MMIPKPKYLDILEDLNEINQHSDLSPYIFRLNKHKKDAEKMMGTDPVEANTILGIISAFLKDIDSMHKYHLSAIKYSNGSAYAFFQYANSLVNSGLRSESYKYFLQAHQKDPEVREYLETLMTICYTLKRDAEYEALKNKLKKMNFDYQDPNVFFEDDDTELDKMFVNVDQALQKNTDLISKPNPELLMEIENLISGVDIS